MYILRRLAQKLSKTSLRMRLFAAFVLLIISSASATILIGNAVFGSNVLKIAKSKLKEDLHLARIVFNQRIETCKLTSSYISSGLANESNSVPRVPCTADIMITIYDGTKYMAIRPNKSKQDVSTCINGTLIPELYTRAKTAHKPVGSALLLDQRHISCLGLSIPKRTKQALVIAAVSEPSNGKAVLLMRILNGKTEMLSYIVRNIAFGKDENYNASFFAGPYRVATTLGNEVLGTRVDPIVEQRVLKEHKTYAGYVRVVKVMFYAAYAPINDISGKCIGMIGVGSSKNIYTAIQKTTTTMFTSLIVGGMIFGFIISYLFSLWLIKPVSKLAEGMHRVAEGDLNHKVEIRSADELGRLARSFNKMVRAVKERDMKLREMTAQKLSQVEKQVSIGRLAAGVAHEINNPLTAVLTLSSLMLKHLPPEDKRREDLEIIISETTRCREIVKNLLDFARETPSQKSIIDINQVVRNTLKLTSKYGAMDRVNIDVELSEEPLLINGDEKQLQQVFTNIILNAAEATGENGSITIHTTADSSGSFAHVVISDTGKGIPQEHMQRIFEPFFTTKGASKGTGLGLSVSLGIVQKHDGAIEIESKVGVGTTVSVILPLAEMPPES